MVVGSHNKSPSDSNRNRAGRLCGGGDARGASSQNHRQLTLAVPGSAGADFSLNHLVMIHFSPL